MHAINHNFFTTFWYAVSFFSVFSSLLKETINSIFHVNGHTTWTVSVDMYM